ncbi:MAG: ABC transporter ATP-binding protein [Candidatus Tyrphobacter sp.]
MVMSAPVLEVHDLYRFYHSGEEETLALRGVNLQVRAGETVAIMGPSGSGKSTLLSCAAGLDEPDGGYVAVSGSRLTRRPEAVRAQMRARHFGIMLQSNNLLPHLTVEENVRLQLHLAGKHGLARAREILHDVGLEQRAGARLGQLSGGEAARAGLAVALAARPDVVLADEPTGEVDAQTEQQILGLLAARKNQGGATILATHSEALAAWADRVVRLRDGRVDE